MTGNPRGSVCKLRELAGSLHINGDTGEQSLLLAIIDTLEEFAEAIDANPESADFFCEQDTGVLISECPSCGEEIHLDFSKLQNGEPMVCDNCHEVIGVITDKM